ILGIQRSLPDFAVGEVVFTRDKGNTDISIPAGTLAATEDTPELPKKVYQTIETVILAKDQSEVTIKVQAINRGEDQDSDAGSIIVMPRPIPGIKSVNNPQPVILIGRRRETDDELRRRAKNALLSSGKANLAALENAVLSLPGVLDVKVREGFHFAKGLVAISRADTTGEALLTKGVIASTGVPPAQKRFRLTDDVYFADSEPEQEGELLSLLEGRQGELQTGSALQFEDASLSGYTIVYTEPILQGQFGMADVIVDTPDFEAIRPKVSEAVENVRAAGIFINIIGPRKVKVDGVFRIEAIPQLNFSPEERITFEESVRQAVIQFFQGIKMGEPMLFSKMMKAVLSVEGVDNLAEFRLITRIDGPGGAISRQFVLADNKIEAAELDRFYATHLCIASEDKLLPVNIAFQATGLDSGKLDQAKASLEAYLNALPAGGTIERSQIENSINTALGASPSNLEVAPASWCPDPDEVIDPATITTYEAKFVEKPTLGNLFGYSQTVQMEGSLLLLLPDNTNDTQKATAKTNVLTAINAYLNALPPEADIVIDDLLNAIRAVKPVLDVRFEEDDLVIKINSIPAPDRFVQGKIDIKSFEKGALGDFLVATDISLVEVTVTAVEITIDSGADASTVQSLVAHTINTFLAGYQPGQDMEFNDLKNTIQNISFGFSFSVTKLTLKAVSVVDGKEQNASLAAPANIEVRTVELAVMKPIANDTVQVTVKAVPIP
ncbi:MAG TPA: baseplate J/gp47 family protein, partial [Flavitalea sp.]|nr:baseplate J/gp47 family protein [Flavitalea sp.]